MIITSLPFQILHEFLLEFRQSPGMTREFVNTL